MSLTLVGAGKMVDAPFAPSDLTNLLGWWRPEELNAGAVASWPAAGGTLGALAQGTGGNQPAFATNQINGRGAVTFDGATDYLATSAAASPTAGASCFAVVNAVAANAYRHLFNHAAAATWVSPFSRFTARISDNATSNLWSFIVEDASVGPNQILSGAAATVGSWMIVEFIYDAANQFIVEDGVTKGTQARTGTLASSTQPFFVGAATDGSTTWNGKLAELIYYGNGKNTTDRASVRSYLQGRYGL